MNPEEDTSLMKLFLLLRHCDIETRWSAASTIVKFGNAAVEPLLKHMYDNDQNVRILSIWALGKIGDKRAISQISQSIHDDDMMIRMASEGALSRLNRV
jgi:HEAT repeat protein